MSRGANIVRLQASLSALVVIAIVSGDVHGQILRARRERVSEASIRGHMEMLASDAMAGRASGTRDEWLAATYVASQLRRYRLEPLGDDDGFVQEVETPPRTVRRPPAAGNSTAAPDVDLPPGHTWNVLGRIPGGRRGHEVILLSAHLDHLGVRGTGADTIFNGADDDASGVTAVLEFARVLADGRRPDRTIIVALFGSEESGGFGARHFIDHPPVPLETIVANLEFEMIGRSDPAVPPHTLWLTGYERSTLGPALASRGARLVADPHPGQNFFQRSDNIQLARRGVVAQTVSSYGLHREYHTPADDLAHIDFAHMTEAIASMVAPIEWLASASFTPGWRPGMQPEARRPAAP